MEYFKTLFYSSKFP